MPQLLADLLMNANIERDTYQLFDSVMSSSTSLPISTSRSNPFFIAVTLTDWSTGSGTVTVTGLNSGVTMTSVLVFSGNERRQELSQDFDSLVSVVTSGFGGAVPSLLGDLLGFILGGSGADSGSVRIDAVSRTGQPKEELTTIATGVKCRVTRERFGSLQQSVGEASMDAARIYFFPGQDLKRQDRVVADGDRWKIKGLQPAFRLSDGMEYYKIAIVHSEEQS